MKNFSLNRLFLLIKKQFIDNAKFYLYGIAALIGLIIISMFIWILSGSKSYNENTLIELYVMGIFIIGAIFSSTSFSYLNSTAKAVSWLLLPTSNLEKLLCAIIYNVIFFTVIYTICFIPIAALTDGYIQNLAAKHTGIRIDGRINWQKPKNVNWNETIYFFYAYMAIQGLYTLGSACFKKYSFIITTAVGTLLVTGFIFLIQTISKSFHLNHYNIIDAGGFPNGIWYKKYSLNTGVNSIIVFLVKFIWAPFFGLVTWYKLKEKEI